MALHYYELPKLPPLNNADSGKDLWLKLFNAQKHLIYAVFRMGLILILPDLTACSNSKPPFSVTKAPKILFFGGFS